MQSIAPPPTFLAVPGEPNMPWEDWQEAFDSYLKALGGAIFTAKRKLALLKHNLGVEGRKVLKTLPCDNFAVNGEGSDEETEEDENKPDM
ncbi:hypothetical protein NDU88_001943 [Pleurodeles waltl]|uniref:Uncharacterized protein n=1 Tax=Pleurodeles waltl TaxID=8319 RepID=A0AAV7RCM4_PLEWA|nr:hypothetical protein NDU88_001943 [Pleurodeles waltl]